MTKIAIFTDTTTQLYHDNQIQYYPKVESSKQMIDAVRYASKNCKDICISIDTSIQMNEHIGPFLYKHCGMRVAIVEVLLDQSIKCYYSIIQILHHLLQSFKQNEMDAVLISHTYCDSLINVIDLDNRKGLEMYGELIATFKKQCEYLTQDQLPIIMQFERLKGRLVKDEEELIESLIINKIKSSW